MKYETKRYNQQAVEELIDVCEKHINHCDDLAKRVGIIKLDKISRFYNEIKKALKNINS